MTSSATAVNLELSFLVSYGQHLVLSVYLYLEWETRGARCLKNM